MSLFTRWVLDFTTADDVKELALALGDQPDAIASLSELAVTPPEDITITGHVCYTPASPRLQGFFAAWRAHFGLDPKQAA